MSNLLKRAAATPDQPGPAAKRIKTASVSSSEIDYISLLPLELLQKIFALLSPARYIAIKFVSRTFNAATFTSSGKDIRGWKGTNNDQLLFTYPHYDYHDGVIAEEASHPTPLRLLTCRRCGQRKTHSIDEFCDKQYDQKLVFRHCIKCYYPLWYTPNWYGLHPPILIHKVAVGRCSRCKELCLMPRRGTGAGTEVLIHRCKPTVVAEMSLGESNAPWMYLLEADEWMEEEHGGRVSEGPMVEKHSLA